MAKGGFNGRFNRFGNEIRNRAKQVWEVGAVVNVGFLRDLTVTARDGADWLLRAKTGATYRFVPHVGLERLS